MFNKKMEKRDNPQKYCRMYKQKKDTIKVGIVAAVADTDEDYYAPHVHINGNNNNSNNARSKWDCTAICCLARLQLGCTVTLFN